MPAGNAYPSGHLVPSPILRLANAPIVETKFLELAMSLLDFSPRIPLGTFSILPYGTKFFLTEAKREVLANLANFAYDPVNYEYMRTLNVADLFLGKLLKGL